MSFKTDSVQVCYVLIECFGHDGYGPPRCVWKDISIVEQLSDYF